MSGVGAYGGTRVPTQQEIIRHACGGIQQQNVSIPPQLQEMIWGGGSKQAKGSNNMLGVTPPRNKQSNLQRGISGKRPMPRKGDMAKVPVYYEGSGHGKGAYGPGRPNPRATGSMRSGGGGGPSMGGGSPYTGGGPTMGGGSPYTGAGSQQTGGGGGIGGFVTPQSQWTPQMQGKYNWQGGDDARREMLGQIDWGDAGAKSAQHKAQMMQEFMRTGVHPGTGAKVGGGSGVGGGVGGGGATLGGNLESMSNAGQGLMEPGSDYYQRLSQAMQQQIGGQSAAQQRSAALRAAQSGLGAGASPELMMTTGDIAQGGLEAQGMAESGLALQAPQLGASMLSSTFNPMLGMQQLAEGSRQFNQGFGENQRQFGINTAMQQQQMAQQQAWQQAQLQAQQQAQQQEALMRQYQMMFGMF